MDSKTNIAAAVRQIGGVTAVAGMLGVSKSRVSNWVARGSVPAEWAVLLARHAGNGFDWQSFRKPSVTTGQQIDHK